MHTKCILLPIISKDPYCDHKEKRQNSKQGIQPKFSATKRVYRAAIINNPQL